jgi:hypothetical protein
MLGAVQTVPRDVWFIVFGLFSAYMLIRIEANLCAIVAMLRQLHAHFIPPYQEDCYPQAKKEIKCSE